MRVLIVHNRYRAEGGEERAVGEIAGLLARHGHTVEVLERTSAGVSRANAARALLTGGVDGEEVAAAVRRLRADVVHAHNLHPLLGWRALAAARAAGARSVLHLHNFRLFCAVGVAYRDGGTCFQCRARNTLPGVLHRCRGSLAEAAVYAVALRAQLPLLLQHADTLVVLSEAHSVRLRALGLPAALSVETLPNFVAASGWAAATRAGEGEYALVAGRLVEEKGFDLAIAAARRAGVPLLVAGEGPDEARLRALAAGADVRFVGWLSADALAAARAGAAAVLVPSRWEEVCPYSVLDALAAGVPTLVSDLGGLPELVDAGGYALPAGDTDAWARTLAALWNDPEARRRRGQQTLAAARERFGEERYLERLLSVYRGG
jgi:glycosyltransferase involved in cell wall biosynthesis